MQKGAVWIDPRLLKRLVFVFGNEIRSWDLPQSFSSVLNASRTTDSRDVPEMRRKVSSSFRY
jgi:hypothetical protein